MDPNGPAAIPVSQREKPKAIYPPKRIDGAQYARMVAAVARSNDLLTQVLGVAKFYAPEGEIERLASTVEAHQRLVRGLTG